MTHSYMMQKLLLVLLVSPLPAHTLVLPVKRASRVRQPQADDDAVEQETLDAAQMGRGSATATRVRRAPTMPTTLPHTPRPKQATRPRSRLHPLFFLGTGMLATLTLIVDKQTCPWVLEIIKRTDGRQGLHLRPHLWIVERSFGWLGHSRRLSKDYECLPQSSEAIIRLMLMRLARHHQVLHCHEQSQSAPSR